MDILMCREFIVRRAQYHGLGPERAQPYKKSSYFIVMHTVQRIIQFSCAAQRKNLTSWT